MGIVKLKNLPSLKLLDLLKRKRRTLKQFVNELGITTYESLNERCTRIGVVPPTKDQFLETQVNLVTSPTEGVLVLDPPPVVVESTGEVLSEYENVYSLLDKKRSKKKKND